MEGIWDTIRRVPSHKITILQKLNLGCTNSNIANGSTGNN